MLLEHCNVWARAALALLALGGGGMLTSIDTGFLRAPSNIQDGDVRILLESHCTNCSLRERCGTIKSTPFISFRFVSLQRTGWEQIWELDIKLYSRSAEHISRVHSDGDTRIVYEEISSMIHSASLSSMAMTSMSKIQPRKAWIATVPFH